MVTATQTKVILKAVVDKKELLAAITAAGKAVSDRPSHPILTNYLITFNDGFLTVTGFDLSTAISVDIPATIQGSLESICIPKQITLDVVSKFPDGELSIGIKEGEASNSFECIFKCGESKYTVKGRSTEEYPNVLTVDAEPFTIETQDFLDFAEVADFASTDQTKGVLQGVKFAGSESEITAYSLDGTCLACVNKIYEGLDFTDVEFIVLAKTLKDIANVVKKDENVTLFVGDAILKVVAQSATICTLLQNGTMPDSGAILARCREKGTNTLSILSSTATPVLDRVATIADKGNGVAKLSFNPDKLTLTAKSRDLGECIDHIDYEYSGEPFNKAAKVSYLLKGIKFIGGNVLIATADGTAPFLLSNPSEERLFMFMPQEYIDD